MRAFLHLAVAALLACEPPLAPAAAKAPVAPAPAPNAPAQAPALAPVPAPAKPTPASATGWRSAAGVEYVEVITGGAGSEDRLPLIVAIHGLGDRPDNFADLVVDLPFAARVILPRGLDPVDEDGFSWFPIRARSTDVAGLSRGIAAAGDKVIAQIRELVAARPTVGKPIVTGFSQGGMLSFYLAVYAPDLFAAAVPVGGWLPPPLWPSGKPEVTPKIVALHGEADVAVKYPPTREAVEKLQDLGWPVELKSWPEVGHAIPPPIRRELHHQLKRALP